MENVVLQSDRGSEGTMKGRGKKKEEADRKRAEKEEQSEGEAEGGEKKGVDS